MTFFLSIIIEIEFFSEYSDSIGLIRFIIFAVASNLWLFKLLIFSFLSFLNFFAFSLKTIIFFSYFSLVRTFFCEIISDSSFLSSSSIFFSLEIFFL